jgi:hypothetical protein
MIDGVADDMSPRIADDRTHGSRRLHAMPDRRRVGRFDRLRQKWWAFRASMRLRMGRHRP